MDANFLWRTGQLRFVFGGLAIQLLGLAAVWVSIAKRAVIGSDLSITLFLGGLILAGAGFAFVCLKVKCPHCGSRIIWKAASSDSLEGSFFRLWSRLDCPDCGHHPESDRQS